MKGRNRMDEQIAAFMRKSVQAEPPLDLVPSILDAVDAAPTVRPRYASLLPALAGATVVVLAVGAVLLLWRPWGVADPSPLLTPSPTASFPASASPDEVPSPSPAPPADALLGPGDSVELAAVDPRGAWGTIRVERGEDLGGYGDADVPSDRFIIEIFLDYEADRLPDPETFGLPDWSLRSVDPGSDADAFFPIAPTRFDRYPTGFRPDTPLGTYPGTVDIFSTPTEGKIAFEVPRDAAGLELELVYRPASMDEAATLVVRVPGEPPDHVAMNAPRTAPEPPAYVEHPDYPITVIGNAEADDLFSRPDSCTNPVDGYTVTFPDDWYTNTETGGVPACSWFTPELYEMDVPGEAPEEIWISIGMVDGVIGYIGTTISYSTDEVIIDRMEVRRVEVNPEPNSDPAYRSYHYVVPLGDEGDGPTLVASTDTDMAGDYELARAVLDRIMASLELDR